jgi:hypothetical protein
MKGGIMAQDLEKPVLENIIQRCETALTGLKSLEAEIVAIRNLAELHLREKN